MNILVINDSLTGNTTTFVNYLMGTYPDHKYTILDSRQVGRVNWDNYDIVFIGCYTWSNGKIPAQVKKMVIEYRDMLMKKPLGLFGSGITIYQKFCGALDNIQIILDQHASFMAKFELTFIPEENEKAIADLDRFLSVRESLSELIKEANNLGYLTEQEEDMYLHDCFIESGFEGTFSEWLDEIDD